MVSRLRVGRDRGGCVIFLLAIWSLETNSPGILSIASLKE